MAERPETDTAPPRISNGVAMKIPNKQIPVTPSQVEAKAKKTYTSPLVTCYGQARSLTLSGRRGKKEGTGRSGASFRPSDRLTKQDLVRIGTHPLGIGLYLYDYKPEYRETWGHARQFGVMADEVEMVMPEAVSTHPDGHKIVDYAMLGISCAA